MSAADAAEGEIQEHDAGEMGGADPLYDNARGNRPLARRNPPQVHIQGVPQAVKCNGWPGCPQDTLGMVPSAIRRVAAHCLEMTRTTVAHPPNRLQMARAARRSRAVGVICNSCLTNPRIARSTEM